MQTVHTDANHFTAILFPQHSNSPLNAVPIFITIIAPEKKNPKKIYLQLATKINVNRVKSATCIDIIIIVIVDISVFKGSVIWCTSLVLRWLLMSMIGLMISRYFHALVLDCIRKKIERNVGTLNIFLFLTIYSYRLVYCHGHSVSVKCDSECFQRHILTMCVARKQSIRYIFFFRHI